MAYIPESKSFAASLHRIFDLVVKPSSYADLSAVTGLAHVTVSVYVRHLCALGALRALPEPGRGPSGRAVTLYARGDARALPPIPEPVDRPPRRVRGVRGRALDDKPGPLRFKTKVVVRRDPLVAAFFGGSP